MYGALDCWNNYPRSKRKVALHTPKVKEQLRAQGIRLTYVPACEIVAQTKQYLEAHPELYEQPCNARGKWACADLSHEQVAQTRALKRLNFLIQLLRFSVPRAY